MTRAAKMFNAFTDADNALVDGVEEVVATISGIVVARPDVRVVLSGFAGITGVVGLTDFALRVRRDTAAGALVGESYTPIVSTTVRFVAVIGVTENRDELSGAVYVLTATAVGGAPTVERCQLTALVL